MGLSLGSTINSDVTLNASHRSQLTMVGSANITVSVVVYDSLRNGTEHRFLNRSDGTFSIQPGNTNPTIKSVSNRRTVAIGGLAVLKYLGDKEFLLYGALTA